jgi:hypothetical protein
MQPISLITFFHLSFPIYFHFSHATNFSCHIFCHLGFLFTYFHSSISHNPSLSSLIIHHYHHHDSSFHLLYFHITCVITIHTIFSLFSQRFKVYTLHWLIIFKWELPQFNKILVEFSLYKNSTQISSWHFLYKSYHKIPTSSSYKMFQVYHQSIFNISLIVHSSS